KQKNQRETASATPRGGVAGPADTQRDKENPECCRQGADRVSAPVRLVTRDGPGLVTSTALPGGAGDLLTNVWLAAQLQHPLRNFICSTWCNVLCRLGSSRRAFRPKPISCPSGSQWPHEIKHDGFPHHCPQDWRAGEVLQPSWQ